MKTQSPWSQKLNPTWEAALNAVNHDWSNKWRHPLHVRCLTPNTPCDANGAAMPSSVSPRVAKQTLLRRESARNGTLYWLVLAKFGCVVRLVAHCQPMR